MNTTKNRIGITSKVLLGISSILLVVSIYTPIWRIELDAPQYPEGLALTIYANRLAGNVDIINGLNHYIGMKTLHAEEFIEFTVLPYIIAFYAIACLSEIFIARKKTLYFLFGAFLLFGIVAMIDFWAWEYNYGHNLNPNAAIIVPGMAYQPPLIGFKQLLNFGAYSIPDVGGWLFITSGLLLVIAIVIESRVTMKVKKLTSVLPLILLGFTSCSEIKPEPVKLNKDNCDNCGMSISDPKFAAEIITSKGRFYKFDDISCMLNYTRDNSDKVTKAKFYISNFVGDNKFIAAETAQFIKSESIASPMGGNVAAFENKDSATSYSVKFQAQLIDWNYLNK